MNRAFFLFLLVASFACANAKAFTLIIDKNTNILMGASDVVFVNNHYDVSFQYGSCFDIFSGCDNRGDFLFGGNLTLAMQASNALQSQVLNQFISGNGPYDTSPWLVNGDVYGSSTMGIVTLYDVFTNNMTWGGVMFVNSDREQNDFQMLLSNANMMSIRDNQVFAIWSPHTTSTVPEPNSLLLVVVALLLIRITKLGIQYTAKSEWRS